MSTFRLICLLFHKKTGGPQIFIAGIDIRRRKSEWSKRVQLTYPQKGVLADTSNSEYMRTIFWAGDSTVQYNNIHTYPQTGIGQVFHLFLHSSVNVENHARNGRSTKSFIDEGRLDAIRNRMKEGDFLFIQFGHNDEKSEDPSRYTSPEGTFPEYLKVYIETAREKGAYPVLISPIPRRHFEDGILRKGIHGPYVEAMKKTAQDMKVPFIDLHAAAWQKMSEAGDQKTREWHMYFGPGLYANYPEGKEDNTHLRYEGAVQYASLIAEGLKSLGGLYSDLLAGTEYEEIKP